MFGPDHVARFIFGLMKRVTGDYSAEVALINGRETILVRERGQLASVIAFDIGGGLIRAIYLIRNPDKLAHVQ